MRKDGEALLDRARNIAEAAGVEVETFLSFAHREPLHERIVAEARHRRADLIVLGTHGRRGVRRMVIGSTAEGVLRLAVTPVLLIRAVIGDASRTEEHEKASRQPALDPV